MRNFGIALIFGMAFVAQQASAKENSVISGSGSASCGQYIDDRSKRSDILDLVYGSWVNGFLSSGNIYRFSAGKPMIALPDPSSMLAYIDKYCMNNPLKSVFEGAIELNHDIE